jgi:hypothetical protein
MPSEELVIEQFDFLPDTLQRGRDFATAHQDDALNNVRLFIFPNAPSRHLGADPDLAELLEINGCPVLPLWRHLQCPERL